jgi:acetylornithine deacetylase
MVMQRIIQPGMTPFELTKQLMEIPSVTGSEGKIADFLSMYLGASGYRVVLQTVETGRCNVLAFAGGTPKVVMCTHIDTVPPVLPVSEDDQYLYGRGACDTKGIIAAMFEAGSRLRQSRLDRFAYALVVGEEVNGAGARIANDFKWGSDFVIVGEPTGNRMARAQKGTFNANLSFTGKAAHSGYPEEGMSAIEGLWAVLTDCRDADWGNDPVLGRGTFNIGVFQGGERANIVPGSASASVMIRTIESVAQVEQKMLQNIGQRATMQIMSANDPHVMHVVEGFRTTVVSFGSDVPYLTTLGKPILVGPGSILDAHTAKEKISKTELMEGADLYERLVRTLLM